MPTTPDGISSQPPGTKAVTQTVVSSAKYNTVNDDIYAGLNKVKPISQGGTGATGIVDAAKGLQTPLLADLAGTHTVGGTATDIVITTLRGWETLSNDMLISFIAAADSEANDDGTTLEVDQTAETIFKKPGPGGEEINIGAGDWYEGGLVTARYVSNANNGAGAFILVGSSGAGVHAIYEYRVAYNNSTALTANAWTTWPLDQMVSDPSGLAVLSANKLEITRSCKMTAKASARLSAIGAASNTIVKIRIFNVDDNVPVKNGNNMHVGNGGDGTTAATLTSEVVAMAEAGKEYRVEYYFWTNSGSANFGQGGTGGMPAALGDVLSLLVELEA